MKKNIIAIAFAFIVANFAFAAQINWEAGYFTSNFAGGTSYLVQMTEGTATIESIAAYIEANGFSRSGTSTFVELSSGELLDDGVGVYADGKALNLDVKTYANLFIVAVSQDMASYAISQNFESVTITDAGVATKHFGTWDSTDTFTTGLVAGTTPPDDSGTGGGSDSGVPEPTALALLALGVAGLALRRRA